MLQRYTARQQKEPDGQTLLIQLTLFRAVMGMSARRAFGHGGLVAVVLAGGSVITRAAHVARLKL